MSRSPNSRPLSRSVILLFLVSLGLTPGCVIPVPESDLTGRIQVSDGMLEAFLLVGQCSRADILLKFGEPDYISENESVMAYTWDVARAIWLSLGPLGGMTGGVIPKQYLVMMEFENDGVLIRVEKTDYIIGKTESKILKWTNPDNRS